MPCRQRFPVDLTRRAAHDDVAWPNRSVLAPRLPRCPSAPTLRTRSPTGSLCAILLFFRARSESFANCVLASARKLGDGDMYIIYIYNIYIYIYSILILICGSRFWLEDSGGSSPCAGPFTCSSRVPVYHTGGLDDGLDIPDHDTKLAIQTMQDPPSVLRW